MLKFGCIIILAIGRERGFRIRPYDVRGKWLIKDIRISPECFRVSRGGRYPRGMKTAVLHDQDRFRNHRHKESIDLTLHQSNKSPAPLFRRASGNVCEDEKCSPRRAR